MKMVEAKFQMSKKTRTRLKLVLLTAFILLFEYGFTVGYCNELNKVLWFDFALNFSDESVSLILDQRVGHIDQSGRKYDDAMNKLSSGKGNLVKRAENIKKLGAKTSKSLPQELIDKSEIEFLEEAIITDE